MRFTLRRKGPISSLAATRRTSEWPILVLFTVFALAGTLGTWYLLARPLLRVAAALSWPAVACEIVTSRVGEHDSDDGTTYSVDIVYRYEHAGRTYESDRYDFLGGASSGYRAKAEIVRRHPPGSTATAWVDPRDPGYAVLDRGFRMVYLVGLVPLLFMTIGVAGIAARLRSRSTAATDAPPPTAPASMIERDGEIVLHPRQSPRAKLIGALVFASFWNGIVSVFVWQVVGDWRAGDLPIFLSLFLVPFVAVGILAAGLVLYQLLALRNPRPSLIVRGGRIEPGATLYLEWRLEGSPSRLVDLRIRLVGREEATYTRGTSSTTARETFEDLPIFESSTPGSFGRGEALFTVPATAVPSFEAPRNKIVWALRVQGRIGRWPDLDDEFPLKVMPAKAALREEVPA